MNALFAAQPICQLLFGPCPLCFVKNRHMLDFGISIILMLGDFRRINFQYPVANRLLELVQRLVTVMMHDLNKGFDIAPSRGEIVTNARITFLFLPLLVARQGFAQHRNQRLIAGEIYCKALFLKLPDRDIQPDQCFSRAGNAGNKTDGFLVIGLRVFNHAHDKFAGTL